MLPGNLRQAMLRLCSDAFFRHINGLVDLVFSVGQPPLDSTHTDRSRRHDQEKWDYEIEEQVLALLGR